MPYIKQERRDILDPLLKALAVTIKTEGDINYSFYKLLKLLVDKNGKSYSEYSKCIAALECAKLEFYREEVAAYEHLKEIENGRIE